MAVTNNPHDLSRSTSSEGSSGSCHAPRKEASEAQPSAEAAGRPHGLVEAARQENLSHGKVMLLYYQLADEETWTAMAETTGWRPELPMNPSVETQVDILKGRLNARKP